MNKHNYLFSITIPVIFFSLMFWGFDTKEQREPQITSNTFSTFTSMECNRELDSLSLVALYNATHDDGPWTNEWDLNQPIDTWFGVILDDEGCVDRLTLVANNLAGVLPPEIGNLSNLDVLVLSNNNLSGNLPEELGNITSITAIDLSNNALTGAIPLSFGNFQLSPTNNESRLGALRLNNNQLSGCFPDTLQFICAMGQTLDGPGVTNGYDFRNNPDLPGGGDFSAFCSDGTGRCEMQELTCRERDSLALVALWNATHENGPWTNEWDLNLPMETWHGVFLNADGCVSTLIPTANNLAGNIPPEIGDLDNLIRLDFTFNSLNGVIPDEIGNLSQLIRLHLHGNRLSGNIPATLGNLSNLTELTIYWNQLTGSIPETLGNLSKLTDLSLSSNQLTGNIPETLGNLTNLTLLILNDNLLSGSIPNELGNLSELNQLWLMQNNLEDCYSDGLLTLCSRSDVIFSDNPLLPWQGDFSRFCAGEEQIGAPCDDSDPNTENDVITEDCGCAGAAIVVNECRERDSLALVALWEATHENGPWTNEWDLSMPMDTWFGVRLNSDGCVDCLDLDGEGECNWSINQGGNNLNGQIPSTIGDLLNLEGFFLNNNDLNGEIPVEIGNLISIQSIAIEGSNLTGTIPSTIGNLESLLELWLGANELNGNIPKEIGKLTNLKKIRLSGGNKLTGSIPIEFYNLTNLEIIDLEVNDLSGSILPDIKKLINLKFLDLGGNELIGEIPKEIGQLQALETLYLSSNQLEGAIPSEIGNLSNLRVLSLAINNLEGSIPESFSNLGNLTWLFLNSNALIGEIPSWLVELPLSKIWLKDNRFSGCYFDNINDICNLEFSIFTSTNGYNFTNNPALPWQGDFSRFCAGEEQIGAPCDDGNPNTTNDAINENCECKGFNPCRMNDSLELVKMYNEWDGANWTYDDMTYRRLLTQTWQNTFDNPIPNAGNAWDFNQPIDTWHGVSLNEDGCVDTLILLSNGLNGNLFDFTLSEAKTVLLRFNELKGNLFDFSGIPNVQELDLQGNELTGNLIDFSNMPNLLRLWLSRNQLTGNLVDFSNLPELSILDLWDNELSGELINYTNLPNLQVLGLSSNQFQGNIPPFSNNTNLSFLLISNNELVGTLPDFTDFTNLSILYLYDNQLTGMIPSFIEQQGSLRRLQLQGNNLTGEVPNFSEFTRLEVINLGRNQLSGTIPDFVNIPNLERLFLNENQLTGNIPVFSGVENLISFSLSNNLITGVIPDFPTPNLEFLYLYNNQLSGNIPASLGDLLSLKILSLEDNQLVGELPESLGELANLYTLELGNNLLTGCFPDSYNLFCTIEERLSASFGNVFEFNKVDFSGNKGLVWEGDFTNICNGESQIGATCDDGNPATEGDILDENCICAGFQPCAPEANGLANAGEDAFYCENEIVFLSGNQPDSTTGNWTSPTGATILNASEITTEITNLTEGENLLIWTLSTTKCGEYDADTVIISYAVGIPQVQPDSFTTFLERDFDASVITNDQLAGVAEWELTITTPPTKGTLNMNPDGSFNYNPNAEYCGTDYFEYEICNVLCPDFCDVARVDLNVILEEDNSIVAPNVITPNGDKYNENFIIPQLYANPTNYPDNKFMVVNQWGDIVYEKDNYQNDWNGVNNNGKELPQATYYYVFDFGDGREKISGKVVILK